MTRHREIRPAASEFPSCYAPYVAAVPDGDIVAHLRAEGEASAAWLATLDHAAARHRYAPEKWSVAEVIGHVADTERVFTYRALRFARGDDWSRVSTRTSSPPWPATTSASPPISPPRTAAVQAATVALFASLAAAAWEQRTAKGEREAGLGAGARLDHGRPRATTGGSCGNGTASAADAPERSAGEG